MLAVDGPASCMHDQHSTTLLAAAVTASRTDGNEVAVCNIHIPHQVQDRQMPREYERRQRAPSAVCSRNG